MQTTVMFKTDKKLKLAAQATAKRMGIPFSAAMNNLMKGFVLNPRLTFDTEPYEPNARTKRILRQTERELERGDVIKSNSIEEAFPDIL